jgi:hypothetical protein
MRDVSIKMYKFGMWKYNNNIIFILQILQIWIAVK